MNYAVIRMVPGIDLHFHFTRWHETEELAKAEAARLCQKEKGAEFGILKIIGKVRMQAFPVVFESFEGHKCTEMLPGSRL